MGYRFSDHDRSIKIENGLGTMYLEKNTVREISLLSSDKIKISIGGCFGSLVIRFRDIEIPSVADSLVFIDTLNTWINSIII